MHKKKRKVVVFFILEGPNYDLITDNNYEKNDHFFSFFMHLDTFLAENAFKCTRGLKNGRVSLTVGNPDCHPNTPTFSCLLGLFES